MATLTELAVGIDAHLKRFEDDPVINAKVDGRKPFYGASSYASGASNYAPGRFVYVEYVSYHDYRYLSKWEAETYLAWLDAGNVGRHHEALRPLTPTPTA